MVVSRLPPQRITQKNFNKFGLIIDWPNERLPPGRNLFRIVVRQSRAGWRIAYLVVREKMIKTLERHPGSMESFEPVRGRGVLFVAAKKNPNAIRSFFLDTPVILKKGVWHGVAALSADFDVKITENMEVSCEYWRLGFGLKGEAPKKRP